MLLGLLIYAEYFSWHDNGVLGAKKSSRSLNCPLQYAVYLFHTLRYDPERGGCLLPEGPRAAALRGVSSSATGTNAAEKLRIPTSRKNIYQVQQQMLSSRLERIFGSNARPSRCQGCWSFRRRGSQTCSWLTCCGRRTTSQLLLLALEL